MSEVRREADRVLREGIRVSFEDGTIPQGLRRFRLDKDDFELMKKMHEKIKSGTSHKMGWAGGSDPRDKKWRCFGLVEGSRRALEDRGVALHSVETPRRDRAREMERNWASCVDVFPNAQESLALERISRAAGTAEQLIAMQPNVHGGSEFLPGHLDWPRHDGFGVVIVTVAVKRGATIFLAGDQELYYFELPEGYAYSLSGDVRNKMTHGVFCFGDGDRESFNLRFGLHDHQKAEAEIYRHWPRLPKSLFSRTQSSSTSATMRRSRTRNG